MNLRTRHIGMFLYAAIAALIILKDIISDPVLVVGLLSPIVVMAGADKIEAIARGTSGKDTK